MKLLQGRLLFDHDHHQGSFLLTSTLVMIVTASLLILTGRGNALPDIPLINDQSGQPQGVMSAPAGMMTPVPSTPPASEPMSVSSTPESALVPAEDAAEILNDEGFRQYQPNELGMIPILMYHMIVTERSTNPNLDQSIIRTVDQFRDDLELLHENDFYTVPLSDVVNNTISAPAGKHPVVLSFDDGTSGQFSFLLDDNGDLVVDDNGDPVPDPTSAVGILEAFSDEHPDFGRGAFFAPLIFNAFAEPDSAQSPYFEQKLHWLADHGYEIGNHTKGHDDLGDLPTDVFIESIAYPISYMDEVLGDIPANQSRILTVPYGVMPDPDLHPDQWELLREGIPYEGETYTLSGMLLAWADPTFPPASISWNHLKIPRIKAADESLAFWMDSLASGGTSVYTSDGDPETIAVPDPLPPAQEGTLDVDALTGSGKTIVWYDPETGKVATANGEALAMIVGGRQRMRFGTRAASGFGHPLLTHD